MGAPLRYTLLVTGTRGGGTAGLELEGKGVG